MRKLENRFAAPLASSAMRTYFSLDPDAKKLESAVKFPLRESERRLLAYFARELLTDADLLRSDGEPSPVKLLAVRDRGILNC